MKKIITIIAVAAFLSGCGHNVLTYTTGKRLNVGINPQTQEAGFQYIDAEQITVVEKDNAKLTVELSSGLDENGKKTSRVSKIIYEIKEQVTQADVDLQNVKK
jgi:heat shock protein HslJ